MRRLLKYLAGLLVLLLVGALGYGAWLRFRPDILDDDPNEQLFTAEEALMEDVLVVAGQVKPAVTIDMRAEASGTVESVSVREGDRVAAGQELLKLDSRLAQSAVEEAEATLRQMELQDAAARLEVDEDSVELKRRVHDRTKSLHDRGLLPRSELEQRELELRTAERGLERAKRNIEGSQARIAQARAAVDQARTQLQHTTIRAPFDAFVIRRMVEVGSGVAGVSQSSTGGTALMTLGDARQSALYAKATAVDAKRLRQGMAARVRLDSDASQVLAAELQTISTAGDVDTSSKLTTFPLVIALKEQAPGGWVNVPAQAEIIVSGNIKSVSVPERCVRADPSGRSYVIVRTQTGTRRRDVEAGVIQKDRIQVRSGLEKGQTVVCRAAS
jgi:RND family efflux transporter MFP subunit